MTVIPIKLVQTSKMPGKSFGTPTAVCKTGSKLRKIKGSVCSFCYACKGHYVMYKRIRDNQWERLNQFNADPDLWVKSMVRALDNQRWFRWFDSGDLQSTLMLSKIVEVCDQTPWVQHWLSTRERKIVRDSLKTDNFPPNLVVRISANYPDKPVKPITGCAIGLVHRSKPPMAYECPAPKQGGQCGECRACWDINMKEVSYAFH